MRITLAFIALALSLVYGRVLAQEPARECASSPSHHAVRIVGRDQSGSLTDQVFPYVAGEQSFYQRLENGWVFALLRAENGWAVRLFDGEPVGDAVDLTSLTPPLRGAPNPRDIFGWHFRNGDNSGPNEGDVNAPQELRAFVISPGLAGTGGFKPSGNQLPASSSQDGIGWLKALDYGLAKPKSGTRARMNYLKFDACLSWPRSDGARDRLLDLASLEFTVEDKETYGSCGLDLGAYELTASFAPRQLGGDFDGDGAGDDIARVTHRQTGKSGLALCRAGSWLDIIGVETLGALRSGYIDQLEGWTWFDRDGDIPRQLQGFELPDSDGPYILLERIEKEAIVLFWRDGAWRTHQVYAYSEP